MSRKLKSCKKVKINDRGVSLVEFLITVAIAVMAFGLLHTSFLAGSTSYRANEAKITAQRSARQAMDNMARELRGGSNIIITQTSGNSQITFNRSGYGTITFAWADSGNSANQILKNSTQIIGNKISALSFTYNNADMVTINLTATETKPYGQPLSVSLQENVMLRLL